MSSDESGDEYVSPRMGDRKVPNSNNFKDMTKWEVTARIRRMIGSSQAWNATLCKGDLNSVHAHLTGDFIFSPQLLSNGAPSHHALRREVAMEAGFGYGEVVDGEVSDEELSDSDSLYTIPLDNGDTVVVDQTVDRPYRRSELVQIARTMAERGDKRDWCNGEE